MEASTAKLNFPVICFTNKQDLLGAPDLNVLTSCTRFALSTDLHTGMEIVDCKLKRFRVQSFRRTGYSRPFPLWLLRGLLFGVEHRVTHDLEPMPPFSLDDLKQRIRSLIEAEPETWAETDDIGKDTARLLSKVAAAKTVKRLYSLAVVDELNAY